MSNLKPIRAEQWQTLLNTCNVNPDASPESQGYLVLPDEVEELPKGRIPATWKPPITTPEVVRNDVPSTDEEDEDVAVNSDRRWSSEDKMRLVCMRADKVGFKVIAKKLGRKYIACRATFCKIRDQAEYKAILKAGDACEESNEDRKEEEEEEAEGEEETKKEKDGLGKPSK